MKWLHSFSVTFAAWTTYGPRIPGGFFLGYILYVLATFEVVTLTSCILRSAMLPLLKRFMEVLLRNYLQRCRHFFPGVFDVLKSLSLQGARLFENCRSHWQEN